MCATATPSIAAHGRGRFDAVLHLAAQVAVTTSVDRPAHRLRDQRARHVQRARSRAPALPGGGLHLRLDQQGLRQDRGRRVELRGNRYAYADRPHGISESEPLDFLSPYGCSKGAADQYVLDFARIYGMRATSFRQSCIYGPRQFGVEDQGWVAWFVIAATARPRHHHLRRRQAGARRAARRRPAARLRGGHPRPRQGRRSRRSTSAAARGTRPVAARTDRDAGGAPRRARFPCSWDDWRPGDQQVYVSDIRKLETTLGWQPDISAEAGVAQLSDWVYKNRRMF